MLKLRARRKKRNTTRRKTRALISVDQIMALFVVILLIGIVLAIFNVLGGMSIQLNDREVPLIPRDYVGTATAMANTFVNLMFIVMLLIILIPLIVWLWNRLAQGGGGGRYVKTPAPLPLVSAVIAVAYTALALAALRPTLR
ncbi:MAG: hypothetical protein QW512_00775 [Thermofilaceae archaeon]